jgi:hypothetical protein
LPSFFTAAAAAATISILPGAGSVSSVAGTARMTTMIRAA